MADFNFSLDQILKLLPILGPIVVWGLRLESRASSIAERVQENSKVIDKIVEGIERDFEKSDERMNKVEARQELYLTEMRNLMFSIQKSISNVEGRLAIKPGD